MFKKPIASIKPYSPLRSSDRRKFREELIKLYPVLENEENKSSDTSCNLLVPEHIQKANIGTHNGHHGVLYVDEFKQPLWVRLDKDRNEILIPSVYTLWKHPNMLPKIPTFTAVISKLIGGANFMIPGIAFPPEGLPDVKEGELVSIVIRGYNIPLAVGIMSVPTNTLERGSTRKGIAVTILHISQDQLWAIGDKSLPPDMDEVQEEDQSVEVENEEEIEEIEEENKEITEYTIEDIDNILQASFYQALTEKLTPSGILPITSSQFYSDYILPSRPVGNENIDVIKFLKVMEKKGIIGLKVRQGDTLLTKVNWESEELQTFRSHKSIEKAASAKLNVACMDENLDKIQIIEVYKPKGAIAEFFEKQGKIYVVLDENLREMLVTKKGENAPVTLTRSPKCIQILEERRTYNKIATIIRGFEEYGFSSNELSEPLKQLCAITQNQYSSPKKPLYEIMIQGPHTKHVINYLVNKRGFPEKYIQITVNTNEYIYIRSSEDKDIIEVQDFNTKEILYKKMRQKVSGSYCSQLVDPISEPDDSIDLKDNTGLLGLLEYKFIWEGEIYLWKKRFLSKEMECKMVHGDDPGIRVALFRPASNSKKMSLGKMTIRYYNMKRIPVNDKRGLEFILLISILSFLDKIEDENLQRKKSREVSTTTTNIIPGVQAAEKRLDEERIRQQVHLGRLKQVADDEESPQYETIPDGIHNEHHFESPEIIRDIVLGLSDGLTVPFALAAGLSSFGDSRVVVMGGVAELIAGAISMGLGGYLAAKSEYDHFESERLREFWEVENCMEAEVQEIIDTNSLTPLIEKLTSNPEKFVDFMMKFELNLEKPDPSRAWKSAFTIGISYLLGGCVPLLPYLFFESAMMGLYVSCIVTLICLIIFGYIKALMTAPEKAFKAAIQTALIGAIAASTAFGVVRLLKPDEPDGL
ncbi:6879_t:CDS:10 [Diversispora eburnea]|uniref:6879_t:CDS:1 n=1 Tax=Diversispora eburnea TaxID=1213867 RepID=A0A9N8YNM3_9GLOM|nr:6879_t:CDS:10 [Diversispora eburnea]